MELNPNHIVMRQAHNHWHKIAALIMVKLGVREVNLTLEDVQKSAGGDINIVLDASREHSAGALCVRIVDGKTALALAKAAGGMAHES